MRVLAVLFGIILLLPGLCSLGFMAVVLPGNPGSGGWLLWIICFAISFGGILMIRAGISGPQPPRPPAD